MSEALYDNERTYWEDRLGDDVPLNSVGFKGLSDSFVSYLYRVRARRFNTLARPIITPGMSVLDIGSGGGFYIGLWKAPGVAHITATDLTEASIRAILRRFPDVKTNRLDIGSSSTAFAAESFDAISCMDVLHHLMDDAAYERAIQNCARLLKPGGFLIFTDNFLHGPAYRGPHHISRSLTHIERIVRGAGFHIAKRKPMFVLMNNPIDSRNALFRFYWRGMSYISESERIGAITGAMLYPLELAFTSLLIESPSTEIALAVKH